MPTLLAGVPAESSTIRAEDQHLIRTWTLPEPADTTATELSHELSANDGWQPPTVRNLNPRTIQFARIHSPNGDFQFTRVTIAEASDGKSSLTIDEEPKQAHAFR